MVSAPSSGSTHKHCNGCGPLSQEGTYNKAGVAFLPSLYFEGDVFSMSEVELGDTYYSLQEGLGDS